MDGIFSTDGPVCPHCQNVHTPDEPFYYDDDLNDMECGNCGETFGVEVYTSTSWTTSKPSLPPSVDLEGG